MSRPLTDKEAIKLLRVILQDAHSINHERWKSAGGQEQEKAYDAFSRKLCRLDDWAKEKEVSNG